MTAAIKPSETTTPTTPTIAEMIAARFESDGQVFRDVEGYWIDDVCMTDCVYSCRSEKRGAMRYEFADGSAIVVTETGWDIGFPGHDLDCFCWPEANGGEHLEGCPEARS